MRTMPDSPPLLERLAEITGQQVASLERLSGGSVGEVYRCDLVGGGRVVVKVDRAVSPLLRVEGKMLRFLARRSRLPVPELIFSSSDLLVMSHVAGESRFPPSAQEHAAELLADLHALTAPHFGLVDEEGGQFDTLIGGLPQPNQPTASWVDFFREQRLLYMAGEAAVSGQLPMEMLPRVERLAQALDRFIDEPARPALIHGDVWTTNMLVSDGRVAAFLDPAVYFADPEIELAFTTLFGTFSAPFFERYREIRPLREGFFEVRRDLYNLYPLLVHVRLFGGSYVQGVARILKRFGF